MASLASNEVAARHLRITAVQLACCAIESSAALAQFDNSLDPGRAAFNPATDLNVLVVSGTVTRTGEAEIVTAFEGLELPRAVVAFGVCTISGGPYWDSYAVLPGIGNSVPIDVAVPGCPPAPADLIAALDELATRLFE